MSNSKVRPASGLSRRELLQRGSLGTAGVLSLGAPVTLKIGMGGIRLMRPEDLP